MPIGSIFLNFSGIDIPVQTDAHPLLITTPFDPRGLALARTSRYVFAPSTDFVPELGESL